MRVSGGLGGGGGFRANEQRQSSRHLGLKINGAFCFALIRATATQPEQCRMLMWCIAFRLPPLLALLLLQCALMV